MIHNAKSIRPFIGSRDFKRSADFYRDLGIEEVVLSPGFSIFKTGGLGFYLQNTYVKDWIDNRWSFSKWMMPRLFLMNFLPSG